MKILQFAPNYLPATRYGGPVRSAHGLASALVDLGHEVHVFTTNVDGLGILDAPLHRPDVFDGVTVRYFAIETPRRVYYSPAMGRAFEAEVESFDIVHVNGMFLWPGPKAAREAKRHGVPLILSPRGMLMPAMIAGKSTLAKRLWIWAQERRSLAAASAIHVTSEEEAQGLRDLRLDLAPVKVVGNGVDLPSSWPSALEIEQRWGGIPKGSRVAFLGRLDWMKGVDLAIEAVARLKEAQILIAGHDQIGLRARLEPRLTAPSGRCAGRFIGPVDGMEKWALLAGADIVLAPSVKESFGIAVAEALAAATPVICTEGVGASTTVRRIDPRCVVARTVEDLAATLQDLLADDARRARYGAQARSIMAQEFSWTAIAKQMAEIYEDALRASRQRRIAC